IQRFEGTCSRYQRGHGGTLSDGFGEFAPGAFGRRLHVLIRKHQKKACDMNIIIVAKPHGIPTALNLRCWRMRAKLAALAAVCILSFGGAGFVTALLFASPRDRALDDLHTLRTQIAQERQHVELIEASSQRGLDALAVQLGELQAQTLRLNALGQRLAQAGKLDDGEFDFTQEPAMGGPEDPQAAPHTLNFDLVGEIATLRGRLNTEETQLSVLEDLLLDRRVDSALLPRGYPV